MADDTLELNEINQLIATIQPLGPNANSSSDPLLGWLAAGQRKESAQLEHPRFCLFSANHGFAADIGLEPDINYDNYIKGCLQGTGLINRLALAANTDLRLYEMDPDARTENALEAEAALSIGDLVRSMAYGMMAVEPGLDLMAAGAFGHGTKQAAQALIALHLDQSSDDLSVARLVKQAKGKKGLQALAQIGGYELAALCGAIIAARLANCPVMLEGAAGYAALLVLEAENKALTDHCRLCGIDASERNWNINLSGPSVRNAEPGIALTCLIPLLRTHVILNDPSLFEESGHEQPHTASM